MALKQAKATVLGCGTSTGVPIPGCSCDVCTSDNPRNKRLRPSIYLELALGNDTNKGVLIDTSTDLRQQALRQKIASIDAVLYTHSHADHIFGIDDLRSFNFIQKNPIPVYAKKSTAADLSRLFKYAFFPDPNYQGGAPPRLELHTIEAYQALNLFGANFIPLPLLHGTMEIFGYRLGNFAYLTDCSSIPEKTKEHLQNLDTLILDGLRDRPHKTHFTLKQAVYEIEQLKPKQSYLTHMSHDIEYEEANQRLAQSTEQNVELAYDGLEFSISGLSQLN